MPIPKRESIKVTGRVLWLTKDAEPLKAQLSGDDLTEVPEPDALIDNISTDELTPGWVCYYYDETLARYCLVGLRGGRLPRRSAHRQGVQIPSPGVAPRRIRIHLSRWHSTVRALPERLC